MDNNYTCDNQGRVIFVYLGHHFDELLIMPISRTLIH